MGNLTSIESKDVPAANPSQEILPPTKLYKIVEVVGGSGADAVQTSTKAVPNEQSEFDLDAEPNPLVINHMKKIGDSLAITLFTVAFPDLDFILEKR